MLAQTPSPPPKPTFHGSKPPERALPQIPVPPSKPAASAEYSVSEVQTHLSEGKQSSSGSTMYYESNNEEIYHTETIVMPPKLVPEHISAPMHSKTKSNANVKQTVEEIEKGGSRRKELPSLPIHSSKQVYRELVNEPTSDNSTGLLLEEEVSLESCDGMNFVRVQSVQPQQQIPHDTGVSLDTNIDTKHFHTFGTANPNSKSSKYGPLGQSRSAKPLPKPRATSGALEMTQSELKLAYFQVNSLQNQLSTQQNELERLKEEIHRYKSEHSELIQKTHAMIENETELKKQLTELRETINLLKIENTQLIQEKEKLSVENEQRMAAIERQTSYLKAELSKSATFADSAIKQILMGATNVNQVAACLNSLGKIDT